jgi:hypothetical protein
MPESSGIFEKDTQMTNATAYMTRQSDATSVLASEDGGAAERWPRPAFWITASAALALGLVLVYEGIHLGFFHGRNEIDDGIYYGEGVMLAHGILPYRSYVDVQPPGMALLMAPFGLLGRLTNNRTGFEAARVFVVIVSMANIGLLGRLVRRRHWVGVLVGVVTLGFYVDSLTADHTVLLEPFLVFGTLLGLLFVFDDTEIATSSTTRWLAAGVILGLTTSIKLWGAFPLLVLLAFAAWRGGRRCVTHYLVGAVAAIAIVCVPFVVLAPGTFVREVVLVQVTRSHAGYNSEAYRLMNLLGATVHAKVFAALWLPTALWFVVAVIIAASIVFQRRVDPSRATTNLDVCAMACLVVVGASFLVAPEFDTHYGGFLALFFALVLSATAVRLLPLARPLMTIAIVGAMLALFVVSVHHVIQQAKEPLPTAALDRTFSPTACVVSEDYGPLILANRYNLYEPQCPHILDIYGTELTDANGAAGAVSDDSAPKLQGDWLDWLHRADGLVLLTPLSRYVGIGPSAQSYIRSHFSLSAVSDGLYIYSRVQSGQK